MTESDKNISELISKSLRLKLEGEESQRLADHLVENEEARKFAELSQAIERSVTQADPDSAEVELSDDAIARMKDSVADASAERLSLSQHGLISASGSTFGGATIREPKGIGKEGTARRVASEFELIRKLGVGGVGTVWLARDLKLRRTVAVKELKTESLTSPAAWNRFHREAEVTGRLEHPNIVPLYQFGDDQTSGQPFYVMRFVGKRTLADAITEYHDRREAGLDDDGLQLHRLLTVFLDVCQAIAYAHSRGVVHRDIKPENIALDNFGQVVVLDWGLAKILEENDERQFVDDEPAMSGFTNTLDGDVVGTPVYMAPEQAMGDLDRISPQTDVYGLGAMLFSILTGAAPHSDTISRLKDSKVSEILKAIAANPTPSVRDRQPETPPELEAVCKKSMAKKQHLRYERVEDLSSDLERWMAGQSEKQARYEGVRMEGRELRANLQSFVNDAERNVRFMSRLPPIQEIIKADSDEEHTVWRSRLKQIFHGLLEANPYYFNVVYGEVCEGQHTELVRVERHGKEYGSIRSVPKSRLKSEKANEYTAMLSLEKPEETLASVVSDSTSDAFDESSDLGLVVGIPVYNEETEDPYGVVTISCDIRRFLNRQLREGRLNAYDIVVASDEFQMMARYENGRVEECLGDCVVENAGHFAAATETLQSELEYLDEVSADVYGARIWFAQRSDFRSGLMYLLKRKE